MRAFFCDKKILATNSMRGKINLRAKFCEHSKKCDHFFASNKIRCEQIFNFQRKLCLPISCIISYELVFYFFCDQNYEIEDSATIFLRQNKNLRPFSCDQYKKKLILRALRQKSVDGKCDQKKTYETARRMSHATAKVSS